MARAYVEDAYTTGHQVSLCWALYAACPVALAVGDLATAERFATTLRERSSRHAPGFLQALAHGLLGELLIKRGEVDGGVQRLRSALDELRASGFALRRPALLGALAEGLAAAGRVAEGLQAIKEALTQCERSEELWNVAELLRIEGELLRLEGTREAIAAAEDRFLQALGWARRQEAPSWELRCATGLARLLNDQQRIGEAHRLLSAAYDRFTEGFETADLKAAKALLDALADAPAPAVGDGWLSSVTLAGRAMPAEGTMIM
jgi:tetratricopeptide (TPR) repeat protein